MSGTVAALNAMLAARIARNRPPIATTSGGVVRENELARVRRTRSEDRRGRHRPRAPPERALRGGERSRTEALSDQRGDRRGHASSGIS